MQTKFVKHPFSPFPQLLRLVLNESANWGIGCLRRRLRCRRGGGRRQVSLEGVLDDRPKVSLLALFRVFFQIGLLSFGGGLVSWIHREVVEARGWMRSEEFLSGMSLSQVLPGINSTNTSIFVGQRLRGAMGATVSVTAMLLGPFIIIILAGVTYKTLLGVSGFPAVVEGVGAVAMGLLTRLGIQAGRSVKLGIAPALATISTFVGVGVLQWPMLAVVAVVAPLSVVAAAWPRGAKSDSADA